MPEFQYKALDNHGVTQKGTIAALDEDEALKTVGAKGLEVFDLKVVASNSVSLINKIFPSLMEISEVDKIAFLRSLTMMLKAKLPIDQAVSIILEGTKNKRLGGKLVHLRDAIRTGEHLPKAFDGAKLGLGSETLGMIKLGVKTNNLPAILEIVVDNMEARRITKSEILKASIYPVILLFFVCLVSLVLIFVLVPALVPMFETSDKSLPVTIDLLYSMNVFLSAYGRIVMLIIAVLCLSVAAMIKLKPLAMASMLYRFPFIGAYTKRVAELEFLTSLYFSNVSGARLSQGVEFAISTLSNEAARYELTNARQDLQSGNTLFKALSKVSFLSAESLAAISAGERVNRLNDVFEQLRNNSRVSLELMSKSFISIIPPVTTIAIGLLIGGIIFSTMSAILEVNDLAF